MSGIVHTLRTACRTIAALACLTGAASAAEPSLAIVPAGDPELVFQWTRDACARDDIPDVPARAFRDVGGTVHLIASHHVNRAMTGPGLDHLRQDCRVIYEGQKRDDPSAYDDRAWIAAPYTLDGRAIYALVHNEFQGHFRADLCPSRNYSACWSNAITFARSADGGANFTQPLAPANLVAALPYKYRGDTGRKSGYFGPSNIVARDGYFYSMIFAVTHEAQAFGVCLIRTDRLDDPRSWRAWDGRGFNARFIDPYRDTGSDPAAHVCTPVGRGRLSAPIGSVTFHEPSGLYIAVMAAIRPLQPGATPVTGLFMATSRDLIEWSPPALIKQMPIPAKFVCEDASLVDFPSLLDPESLSRNFETVGARAFIYMTRFNLEGCKIGMNRDLLRLPVKIAPAP
jgi:hypothetical protein